MLAAASLAFRDILSPPFRGVLLKSLAQTLALLAVLWALIAWLLASVVTLPWEGLDTAFSVLTGVGLLIGLAFLVAPVTALFAGLFLDDIAEIVEHTHYPDEPVGRPQPVLASLATSLRFLGAVILVNAIALPLVLVVGFGLLVFLLANGYLLGREYFELAALRHHGIEEVHRLRARNAGRIFAAGLLIAAFLAVPILNIIGPLFATAFMIHVRQRLVR